MLIDVTDRCWPAYQSIAKFMFKLLCDYVSIEINTREPEVQIDSIEVTSTLLRICSWRLFIHEAPGCMKTLHNLCHYANRCLESSDFDERALGIH